MKGMIVPSSKQALKEQAEIRQAKYNTLSIDEKIVKTTQRGGSKKELAKLTEKKLKQIKENNK
jgi:hypothetical protein